MKKHRQESGVFSNEIFRSKREIQNEFFSYQSLSTQDFYIQTLKNKFLEVFLKNIKESLEMYHEIEHDQSLETIYKEIPSGQCSGCGNCCAESVHIFYSEFLSIYDHLVHLDKLEETLDRVKAFHVQEWSKAQKCIFLDSDNRCEIYPVRPLVCRLFGHKSKKQHNKDYKLIKKRNKQVDKAIFQVHGVHISKEVLKHKIRYCKDFIKDQDMPLGDHNALMDRMYGLEMVYLAEGYIDEGDFDKSLTQWFVDFFLPDLKDPKVRIANLLVEKS